VNYWVRAGNKWVQVIGVIFLKSVYQELALLMFLTIGLPAALFGFIILRRGIWKILVAYYSETGHDGGG